ncbi:MAG TPA: ROK family protein [Ilumatobacter sp.]|nr:ROK family protein [Ilumatobacter sp.]
MTSPGTRPAITVALDIGGSSVKSGRVVDGAPAGEVVITPLVRDAPADALVAALAAAIRVPAGDTGDGPLHVAAAVPHPFDHAAGVSLMTHKFAALHGRPLGPLIAAELGRVVSVRWCNDAAAAVAGEALAGAGAGRRTVLGVTLGTGLGAALVRDGAVVAEVGDVTIGNLWQTRLSGGRVADRAFAARTLLAAVEADAGAGGARFGAELADLLDPIVAAAGADIVVVGGGGAGSFAHIADAMRQRLPVPVEPARLGPWAALLGATHLT